MEPGKRLEDLFKKEKPSRFLGFKTAFSTLGHSISGYYQNAISAIKTLNFPSPKISKKKIVATAGGVAAAVIIAYAALNSYQYQAAPTGPEPTATVTATSVPTATAVPTPTYTPEPTAQPATPTPQVAPPKMELSVKASQPQYKNGSLELSLEASDANNLAKRVEVYSGQTKISEAEVDGKGVFDFTIPAKPQDLTVKVYDEKGKSVEYKIILNEVEPGKTIEEKTLVKQAQTIESKVIVEPESYVLTIAKEHNSALGPLAVVRSIITKGSPVEALRELEGKDTMYNARSSGLAKDVVYEPDVDKLPDELMINGKIQPLHLGDKLDLSAEWVAKYGAGSSSGVEHIPAKEEVKFETKPAEYATITTFQPPKYEIKIEQKDSTSQSSIPFGGHPINDPNNTLDGRILAAVAATGLATTAAVLAARRNVPQNAPETPKLQNFEYKKAALDDLDLLVHLYEETDMSINQIRKTMIEETGMNWSIGTIYRTIDKMLGKARRHNNSSTAAYEAYRSKLDSLEMAAMKNAA